MNLSEALPYSVSSTKKCGFQPTTESEELARVELTFIEFCDRQLGQKHEHLELEIAIVEDG